MAEAPYAGITRSGSAVGGQPATLSARSSELPRFVGMTLPRADRPAQPTFGDRDAEDHDQRPDEVVPGQPVAEHHDPERHGNDGNEVGDGRCGGGADVADQCVVCLLYTSDAADD